MVTKVLPVIAAVAALGFGTARAQSLPLPLLNGPETNLVTSSHLIHKTQFTTYNYGPGAFQPGHMTMCNRFGTQVNCF